MEATTMQKGTPIDILRSPHPDQRGIDAQAAHLLRQSAAVVEPKPAPAMPGVTQAGVPGPRRPQA
jgi:hypothetical protein